MIMEEGLKEEIQWSPWMYATGLTDTLLNALLL